jgi:hypothetical protein
MKIFVRLALLVCAVAALAVPAASASASPFPVTLTFDKTATGPTEWKGTIGGDLTGTLTTELRDVRVVGPIWFVTFDWIIDAGPSSFTARLDGILNTKTGGVLMTGRVVAGRWLGAPVIEEGQLVNPATSEFAGTIRVFAWSA